MIDLLINEISKDRESVTEFIIDNTSLKNGIYIKVNIDEPFDGKEFKDYFVVSGKHTNESDYQCELDLKEKDSLLKYIRERDILSGLLNDDANKTIDGAGKKILSSTYQTLFISNKFIQFSEKSKIKSAEEFCNLICEKGLNSYRTIGDKIRETLRLKKLKHEDLELEESLSFAESEERLCEIDLIEDYLKANFENILNFVNEKKISSADRTKIFFYSKSRKIDDSIDAFKRESSYYLSNYIFNKSTTELVDGELKGSISYGFNNNEAKILLRPKRMNISFVKSHSLNEALDVKFAFELLKLISDNRSARMFAFDNMTEENLFTCNLDKLVDFSEYNKSMFFKLHFKDKYIEEYDLISEKFKTSNVTGKKTINCKNHLNNNFEFLRKSDGDKERKSEFTIKQLLAFIIHSKYETLNKYSEYNSYGLMLSDKGVMTLERKNAIIFNKYKYKMHEFLSDSTPSESLINFIVDDFTKETILAYAGTMFISPYYRTKLTELINIKMNLLEKYRKEHELLMTLTSMNEKLEKLKKEEVDSIVIESDAEYYFLMGQVSYYLETQTKGDTNFGILKFYTEKRIDKRLKDYLIKRFEMYSYNINLHNKFFKGVLTAVLGYKPTVDISKKIEVFYSGVCADNMFYKKK